VARLSLCERITGVAFSPHKQATQSTSGALMFVVVLLLGVVSAEAQLMPMGLTPKADTNSSQQAATPARNTIATADSPIPLPQIADRAEQLDRLLREISHELISGPEIQEVQQKMEARAEELHERVLQLDELVNGTPTSMELDDEQRYWRARSYEYGVQRRVVTGHAAKLEQQLHLLDDQRAIWQATWNEVKGTEGIEVLLVRIRQELDAVEATHLAVQQQLNQVLTLQNQVSRYDQQISEMLSRIREAIDRQRGRLFEQDSRPLWETQGLPKLEQPRALRIQQSFQRSSKRVGEFLRTHKVAVSCLFALFGITLAGLIKLRCYVEQHMPKKNVRSVNSSV
jgi:potassium-dependent mechanosensitive channel